MTQSDHEDEVLNDLIIAAKFKFSIHRSKGGWEHKSTEILLKELKREVEELEEALEIGKTEHIVSEAADVTNYLAMLVEKVKK